MLVVAARMAANWLPALAEPFYMAMRI